MSEIRSTVIKICFVLIIIIIIVHCIWYVIDENKKIDFSIIKKDCLIGNLNQHCIGNIVIYSRENTLLGKRTGEYWFGDGLYAYNIEDDSVYLIKKLKKPFSYWVDKYVITSNYIVGCGGFSWKGVPDEIRLYDAHMNEMIFPDSSDITSDITLVNGLSINNNLIIYPKILFNDDHSNDTLIVSYDIDKGAETILMELKNSYVEDPLITNDSVYIYDYYWKRIYFSEIGSNKVDEYEFMGKGILDFCEKRKNVIVALMEDGELREYDLNKKSYRTVNDLIDYSIMQEPDLYLENRLTYKDGNVYITYPNGNISVADIESGKNRILINQLEDLTDISIYHVNYCDDYIAIEYQWENSSRIMKIYDYNGKLLRIKEL